MDTTRDRVIGTALGVAAAWATNLAILLLGNAGAPVRVVTGWEPDGADLTAIEVLGSSFVAVAGAGVALWWWERRSAKAMGQWSAAVAVLAALSAVPLWRLDVDTGSKAALTLMHLATGACAILGQSLRATRAVLRAPREEPSAAG